MMRVLLVGAGAVGQVYGLHLQRGGAEVSVFVRPRYAKQAQAGFPMFELRSKTKVIEHCFTPVEVHCDPASLPEEGFDQLWFCVPAGALTEPFLQSLADNVGEHCTVVSLQPGLHVQQALRPFFPEQRVISGLIGMVSYQTPLKDDIRALPRGVAYYLSSLAPSLFSGPHPATPKIVRELSRHGCPSRLVADAEATAGLSSCLLMAYVAALESVEFRITSLWLGNEGTLAAKAAREALAAAACDLGRRPPWYRHLLRRSLFRLVFAVAEWLAPFALEPYLRYHFSKVAPQTRLLLQGYAEAAKRHALPSAAIESLLHALPQLPTALPCDTEGASDNRA